MNSDPSSHFVFSPEATYLPGNWTSVASRWGTTANYFHWFLDALTRLALLSEFPPDAKIIVWGKLRPFQKESLALMGLGDRFRETEEPHLVVENYYFSAPQTMTGHTNTLGIKFLRETFLPHATTSWRGQPLPKAFYITRKFAPHRKILNEAAIIEWFRQQGWAIVELEGMSLIEQISLFQNAEALCGYHGAAFTNLLWCKPGCKVLELFSSTYLNGCYEGLAEAVGCDYHFLVSPGNALYETSIDMEKLQSTISGWALRTH